MNTFIFWLNQKEDSKLNNNSWRVKVKMKQAPNMMAQVANRILTPKNNHLHHQNKKKMAQTDR